MKNIIKKIILLFFVLLISSCDPIYGFLESEFILSPDSPLPAWYPSLPKGTNRNEVTIKVMCYTPLLPVNNTKFIVEKGVWRALYTGTGQMEFHPKYWSWAQKDWPGRANPSFSNLTIAGKTEIIEHKNAGNVLYVSNENAVKNLLGSEY